MKDEAQIHDLIAKYLTGEVNEQEAAQLLHWRQSAADNQAFFEEMSGLWNLTAEAEIQLPRTPNVAAAWERLEANLGDSTPISAKTVRLSNRYLWYRVAAVVLLLIAVGIWLFREPVPVEQWTLVQTGLKEQREVVLPDGSRVWLNEASEMRYLSDFNPRAVQLSGEAFFEVEKQEGRPFEIQSGETRTKVLGTSFNIRAYPDEGQIEVTVETGIVTLTAFDQPKQELELPAGTSGIYTKTTASVAKTEQKISNANAWQTEQLEFDNLSMQAVQQALERYYGIDLEIANADIMKCHFTGTFNNAPVQEILEAFKFIFGLQVEQHDDQYLLKGGSCK